MSVGHSELVLAAFGVLLSMGSICVRTDLKQDGLDHMFTGRCLLLTCGHLLLLPVGPHGAAAHPPPHPQS